MPQATGAKSRVIAVTETTFNTVPGVVDAERLHIRTFTVEPDVPREQDPTISGFRGQPRGVLGRNNVTGNVQVTLAPESIGIWLKHLIGTPTTTGAGPYTHTFQVGEVALALPAGITFEQDFGAAIAVPGRYLRYSGCRINQGTFQFSSANALQTASFDLLGTSFDNTAVASIDDTPTDPGHAGWGLGNVSLTLDGGATQVCLESLDMVWNNDLDADLFCINNGGTRHDLPEGFAIVTGSGVAQFDTPALLNKAWNDEDLALQVTLSRGDGLGTAGNESLVITIPLSSMDKFGVPINGPRGLKQNFNWVAHRGVGELGITAVLKNARATI